jgi:hypothetical protein
MFQISQVSRSFVSTQAFRASALFAAKTAMFFRKARTV